MATTVYQNGNVFRATKFLKPRHAASFAMMVAGHPNPAYRYIDVEERGGKQRVIFDTPNIKSVILRENKARAERATGMTFTEVTIRTRHHIRGLAWLCTTAEGKRYVITELSGCTCPDNQFRCRQSGGEVQCKHSIALDKAEITAKAEIVMDWYPDHEDEGQSVTDQWEQEVIAAVLSEAA